MYKAMKMAHHIHTKREKAQTKCGTEAALTGQQCLLVKVWVVLVVWLEVHVFTVQLHKYCTESELHQSTLDAQCRQYMHCVPLRAQRMLSTVTVTINILAKMCITDTLGHHNSDHMHGSLWIGSFFFLASPIQHLLSLFSASLHRMSLRVGCAHWADHPRSVLHLHCAALEH